MTDPLNDMAADCPCTAELVFSEPANDLPHVIACPQHKAGMTHCSAPIAGYLWQSHAGKAVKHQETISKVSCTNKLRIL